MKIKQVEELVGISSKNIRFYEDQGLLSPTRSENGYRDYHESDIKRLKQIKFLRKLGVPILTHGDYDHMGEAINLVNNIKIEKVIFNCGPYNDLEQE